MGALGRSQAGKRIGSTVAIALVVALALSCASAAFLYAFSTRLASGTCTPVNDPLHPPVYPNAANVRVVPATNPAWLDVMETTSFHTSDTPQAVLAYYRVAMETQGWTPQFQLSEALKTPGTAKQDVVEREIATMPDVVDVLGFAAYCGTTSAHPIVVKIVVRSSQDGGTDVDLRVY